MSPSKRKAQGLLLLFVNTIYFFNFPVIIDFTVRIILIIAFLQVFNQCLILIDDRYITCIYPLT